MKTSESTPVPRASNSPSSEELSNLESSITSRVPVWIQWAQNPRTAWFVLAASILAWVTAWQWSSNSMQSSGQERFHLEMENAQAAIQYRMRGYENVLRGVEGLFRANTPLHRTQWSNYVATLQLHDSHSGIQSIGFVQWIPSGELDDVIRKVRKDGLPHFEMHPSPPRSEYSAILFVAPAEGRHLKSLGYDMWNDPTQRQAMSAARDLKQPVLTGKVTLTQVTGSNAPPAVVMYIPVYEAGPDPSPAGDRSQTLLGWVYAAFTMTDLMHGILGRHHPHLEFALFDGHGKNTAALLYSCRHEHPEESLEDADRTPVYAADRFIPMAGRTWTVQYQSTPSFDRAYAPKHPILMTVSGIFINLLLFFAFWSFSRRQSDLRRFNLELEKRVREGTRETLDLRAALDHHSIVASTDPQGNITYANEKFVSLSKFERSELLGQNHRILNSGHHSPEFFKKLWKTIAQGEVWHGELCNRAKDGSLYWVETTIVPFLDNHGKPRSYISVRTDITRRRLAEEQLIRSKETAEAANKAKSEFLAAMSHEIRTPMNGVLGFTNLLLDTPLNPDQKQFVTTIKHSGEALLTVINDILDFSKVESGKLILENARFDLIRAVEEVAELVSPKCADKGIELALRVDPGIPAFLIGDAGRTRQILLNLVGNAVKFTERGHILIHLSLDTSEKASNESETDSSAPKFNRVKVSITDTGIGIPTEKHGKLFQLFTQADTSTTRRFGGTGLGLAISRHLVQLMGGSIGLSSQPGQGSTFWFTLPTPPTPYPIAHAAPPPRELTDLRFLIVNSFPLHLELFADIFARWNLDCQTCTTVSEATQKLHNAQILGNPFHVVILDSQPSESLAVEFATTLRSDPVLKRTILVCTTHAGQRNTNHGHSTGPLFDAFLNKPILRIQMLSDTLLEATVQRRKHMVSNGPVSSTRFLRQNSTTLHYSQPKPNPPSSTAATPAESIPFRVLLAEDNPTNQLLAKRLLAKLHCNVDVARHGKEALHMVQNASYDMVFMDCHMPEMDGFRATIEIRKWEAAQADPRAHAPLKRLPIIAVTASARETDRLECLASGMDDFITKPVHPDALRKALDKWGRRPTIAP